MSIELLLSATKKLNENGFDCNLRSTNDGFECISIHYQHGHMITFNNYEGNKQQFDFRLSLLAKNGLRGKFHAS